MLYTCASVAADVVAYKFVIFFSFVQCGATIIFPLTYILGDIICEVYGWNIAMKIVWLGLVCEAIFALLIYYVINLQPGGIGQYQNEYIHVLGNMWVFVFAGIISNLIAGLLNIYFISKWKIFLKGKVFWIRSIISTCISELILIFITVLIAFVPLLQFSVTMEIFYNAYILEIVYAILFVFPAQLLVNILKNQEGIDAYDYGVSYNPFKFVYVGE
jgi:uncharacterized integral membrane protein (TIGR00697 family)